MIVRTHLGVTVVELDAAQAAEVAVVICDLVRAGSVHPRGTLAQLAAAVVASLPVPSAPTPEDTWSRAAS